MASLYNQAGANVRRTWVLMITFFLVILGIGWALSYVYGDPSILLVAFAISVVMNIGAYWFSDSVSLASSGAKEADPKQYLELHRLVENLSIASGLPKPKVYVIEDSAPNAFATGRDPKHGAVAVTTGLMAMLDRTELEGVIAHELSHIKNRDTLVMTVTVVLVGLVTLIADWGLRMAFTNRGESDNKLGVVGLVIGLALVVLSPIIAQLIQLAISRKREFLADASGALMTRYPEGLASALEKISGYDVPMRSANHATAHLFIASPFGDSKKEKRSFLNNLFSTHPPVEERVQALRNSGV
jgi:heat shock protein HtpX